jgi:transportin-3
MYFRDSDVSYGLDVTVEIEKNRRLQIFRPKFETLVSLVSIFFLEHAGEPHIISLGEGKRPKTPTKTKMT